MMFLRRHGALLAGALSGLALLSLVASRTALSPPPEPATRAASAPAARALPAVQSLYEHGTSAYQVRLFAAEDSVVLATQTGFVTFDADGSMHERTISLGPVAARQGGALVFWRAGRLREVSLAGGDEHDVAPVPLPPRYLLASERRLAWIYTERETGTTLHTLDAGQPRVSYSADGLRVSAPVLRDADIYWVAEARDTTWSIRRVALDSGRADDQPSSAAHHGRPPAMLAIGNDGLYFYAGPQGGVRRLTFDLQHEVSVLTGAVCSPLAVSSRVVCATVGGLYDIPVGGGPPRLLASERAGPITALAAMNSRIIWVTDSGADQLQARSVALPGL